MTPTLPGIGVPVHTHKDCAMDKHAKLLRSILSGDADANTRFADLVRLLLHLGFSQRIR